MVGDKKKLAAASSILSQAVGCVVFARYVCSMLCQLGRVGFSVILFCRTLHANYGL